MKKPVVSIIMATYNRAHLISESLVSIQNQTFKSWECLIIDDGSNDNTAEVVNRFISEDSRFVYLPRKSEYKKGLSGCRNQGLDFARGAYLIFFDDDDIVHPDNLELCTKLLIGTSYSFCRYNKKPFFDNLKKPVFSNTQEPKIRVFELRDIDDMITGKVPFASCTVMWHQRCFSKERFIEELMYAEEWECYSRILLKGYKGISIDEVLYYNRKHLNSNTGEFFSNDHVRVKSKIRAVQLILENIGQRDLMNKDLEKFFIRLGFQLNSLEVIKLALENCNSGFYKKRKYVLGYYLYPLLRPLFKLKGNLKLN